MLEHQHFTTHLGDPNSTSGTAFDEVCVILRRRPVGCKADSGSESISRILQGGPPMVVINGVIITLINCLINE